MYINWFIWIIFFQYLICYTKIGGNVNSPNSLNVMVYYHYHGENRLITRLLSYMPDTGAIGSLSPPVPANQNLLSLDRRIFRIQYKRITVIAKY